MILFPNKIFRGGGVQFKSVRGFNLHASVFQAPAPRGAFADDRVIITLVDVGEIDCDMPHAEISLAHTNTCLLGSRPGHPLD